jgi:prepilin-type N-terminal cleavage/methylation domain-containing protein
MRRFARKPRGVTLIELMVVVAIIAGIAAYAGFRMTRARPRASLSSATIELRALLHQARSQALVSGADVWVMVFPGVSGDARSLGRVVVYQDGLFNFFVAGSAVHFGGYNPLTLGAGKDAGGNFKAEVITTFDLPPDVTFGPAAGLGATATLKAPFASIPVTAECTFCAGTGTARRGAVVFDPRGRARFYNADGLPLPVDGGSLSLTSTELVNATPLIRLVAITATTGSLQSVNQD